MAELTEQQAKILEMHFHDQMSFSDIARELNLKKSTVAGYWKRIKQKAFDVLEVDIDEIRDKTKEVSQFQDKDIEDTFDEFTNRSRNNESVDENQVKCMTGYMQHRSKKNKSTKGTRKKANNWVKIIDMGMTPAGHMTEKILDTDTIKSIARAEQEYRYLSNNPGSATNEYMAMLELYLRSKGVLYWTPYINRCNGRDINILRAQHGTDNNTRKHGSRVIIVYPGETPPKGSKFIETVRSYEGNDVEYRVYIKT